MKTHRTLPHLKRRAVLLAAVAASSAGAATDTYTSTSSGLWSTPSVWSAGVPTSTNDVLVTTPGGGQTITVTYDVAVAPANTNVASLTVDTTPANSSITFAQAVKTLGVAGNEIIGASGRGVVVQTGGTNTNGALYLGYNVGGLGTYNLSAGTLNNLGGEQVGVSGTGVFNQGGGVHNAYFLAVGNFLQPGASGTYNLSNGATLNVSNNESVGDSGVGFVNQTGGVHTVNGNLGLLVGFQASASGTYTLSGGTLSVGTNGTGAEYVGYYGAGVMNHTGGADAATFLTLGANVASSGTYTLSGAATLNVTGSEIVGQSGNGVFNQAGGSNVTSRLYLGSGSGPGNARSNGTYNLGNGATLTASTVENVGEAGNGVFNQTGGVNFTPSLVLGDVIGSSGTYVLASGATLTAPNTEYVAAGVFNHTGGVNTTGELDLGENGAAGTYVLANDATLTVAVNERLGVAGSGTFNQTGGSNFVGGALVVSSSGTGVTGVYNLSGGLLIAAAVNVNAGGTFNQTGGTLNAPIFNQNGGVITGNLQNTGVFNYVGGTFAGRLINQGTAILGGAFTAGNGIENDATLTVYAGTTVTLNGAGLDNFGTFTLQLGGNLLGAGPVVNDYGGVMTAAGAIPSLSFANYGQLNLAGQLTVSNPMTNAGVVNVAAGQALRAAGVANTGVINLTGGALIGAGVVTNNPGGQIQGGGAVASVANTGGVILANAAVPLTITTLTAASAGSTLRVANNSTLNVTSPFTSAGVINLQGTAAAFNGGAVTNLGSITGVGAVSNALVNRGVIRPDGGTLAFTAAGILNDAAGQVIASTGNTAFFAQSLTNAGTIALGGGAVDTNGQPLNNPGSILGNGTIRTGGLLNAGTLSLADVASSIYGPVTNTGSLKITSNTTTFYGPVVNNGTLKTTAAVARFLAPFTNNGVYVSDPSTQFFTDLTLGPAGELVGGAGDVFTLTGSLRSTSTRADAWSTRAAALAFVAGGSSIHDLDVSGADAWGSLELAAGQSLLLHDADATPGGALYASILQLDTPPADALPAYIATHLINEDAADPINIYYDPTANAYLADQTYPLGNGGVLAPAIATPEPVSLATWLAAGVAATARLRRPRRGMGFQPMRKA